MTKYCSICGEGNQDDSLFCSMCGTKLSDEKEEEVIPQSSGYQVPQQYKPETTVTNPYLPPLSQSWDLEPTDVNLKSLTDNSWFNASIMLSWIAVVVLFIAGIITFFLNFILALVIIGAAGLLLWGITQVKIGNPRAKNSIIIIHSTLILFGLATNSLILVLPISGVALYTFIANPEVGRLFETEKKQFLKEHT